MAIIKWNEEEIDTNRTHLNFNLHERKDGLSDYDFVKSSNGIPLAKNVRKREDINWVGSSWVITFTREPTEKRPQKRLTKHQIAFESLSHDFLGKRYGLLSGGGHVPHGQNNPTHAHKNHSSHL